MTGVKVMEESNRTRSSPASRKPLFAGKRCARYGTLLWKAVPSRVVPNCHSPVGAFEALHLPATTRRTTW